MAFSGGLMKFFGKGTTTRLIEEPEEKRDRLVRFFSDNIHNKVYINFLSFIFFRNKEFMLDESIK